VLGEGVDQLDRHALMVQLLVVHVIHGGNPMTSVDYSTRSRQKAPIDTQVRIATPSGICEPVRFRPRAAD
jgi:hypothetical protein